mgnify:CR=1 FL=1
MKNKKISKERKKYLNKTKTNKILIILTQLVILIRIFSHLGNTCK